MKWSLKLGTVRGIGIYVHVSFVILVGWVALSNFFSTSSIPQALDTTIYLMLVFGALVLHELGHALTARHFGIATREITLWPIGGIARLERIPREPMQELLITLAGPAVNAVLALLLGLATLIPGHPEIVGRLALSNVLLAVFNLIPVFPMDGGRVLRAILAMRIPYLTATRWAVTIGKIGAGIMVVSGILFLNPLLPLIGMFLWLAAEGEYRLVRFLTSGGYSPYCA